MTLSPVVGGRGGELSAHGHPEDRGQLPPHLAALGIALPFDEVVETGPTSPLAQPYRRAAGIIGNRFAVLPMEGWDGTADGRPTDLTRRRWRHFGLSRPQAHLGRRGGRGPARWPRQSQSAGPQ